MAKARTSRPPAVPLRRRASALMALGLALLTALLFARACGNGFVNYDDNLYVTGNEHVLAGLTPESVRWALTAEVVSNWHPLTVLSHQLDVTLFGRNAAGHHATSVLLHALNAALAFLVLRRLTGAYWRSALVAALFAWHPLRVESVAWIAERKDVLSGCCFFLCLWSYTAYVERRRRGAPAWGWYGLTLLTCGLGLTAKPMLVTLPCLLLLLDFWPLRRFGGAAVATVGAEEAKEAPPATLASLLLEKVPLLLLAGAAAVVTYLVQADSGAVSGALGLGARLANAVIAVWRYVGHLLVPTDLAVLYPHPGHWHPGLVWLAATGLVAVTVAVLWRARREPWLAVGWCWFLGMLVPVSGVVQVGLQAMADRYTYLPAIGLTIIAVWGGAELLERRRAGAGRPDAPRHLGGGVVVAVVLVLGAFAVATVRQIGVWRDSLTLFNHTLAVAGEGNYLAYDNRGVAYGEAGQAELAFADHQKAVALRPEYPDANNNLGRALAARGRFQEAIAHYRVALKGKPNQLEVHNNLANALADTGALDEAITHYRFVLERAPRHVNARNGYAVALAMQGRVPEAERELREVLRLEPGNAGALSNLGNVCAMSGRREEAIALYTRALDVQPRDGAVLLNLGNLQVELGQLDAAQGSFRQAVALRPGNPDAHAALGLVLDRLGRRDEAIREWTIALQQRPDSPRVRAWLDAATAARAGR
ncbi:tetratricopeptide repeat protein [Opitutus sp. ER46]|uniref:tetratricopeptide repeat protein n=1 Tax=Opitutus sp. ER46 TaxID=2161864 RepID=UPI000D2F6912|nr:tetratricopeptide repeat protein [Opitutus sp. ER46]PTX90665.1 hypothetical protein DB354_18535 [Opitutus sp. ER46]